jgi:hypothetical protein
MKSLMLLVAASLISAPALAQRAPPSSSAAAPARPAGVSLQQLQAQQWGQLAPIDRDKDGRITRAEWNAAAALASGRLTPALWDRLDANKDAVITRDEVDARVSAAFAAMDANHDMLVTREEDQAYEAAARTRQGAPAALSAPSPAKPATPPPRS